MHPINMTCITHWCNGPKRGLPVTLTSEEAFGWPGWRQRGGLDRFRIPLSSRGGRGIGEAPANLDPEKKNRDLIQGVICRTRLSILMDTELDTYSSLWPKLVLLNSRCPEWKPEGVTYASMIGRFFAL